MRKKKQNTEINTRLLKLILKAGFILGDTKNPELRYLAKLGLIRPVALIGTSHEVYIMTFNGEYFLRTQCFS
jgi:hypothetical protein